MDGLYVEGFVENEPVIFTADTGASRTIIASQVYDRMDKGDRPELGKSSSLKGAGGSPIRERGKATFKLTLGPLEVVTEAIVADVEDEVLLGYDILGDEEKGQADILLSKNVIRLRGKEIPCIKRKKGRGPRKVTMVDDVVLPGLTETVVNVLVERTEDDDMLCGDFIVEATDSFKEGYPLQMAVTLVDINKTPTCKVRVLNPFPSEVKLRQDAVIGKAEQIDKIVNVITENEYTHETENYASIKRIQVDKGHKLEHDKGYNNTRGTRVPSHLKALFEKSVERKSESEKTMVARLLREYEDIFSKGEWDVGLTNLTEHEIKTGDAEPIRQRPRKVPLAYAEEEKKAIEDLLAKGVIRKSTSPWASPIVLVKKKSGAIRPCVDYRRVNALVKPDGFPLPRIQDCLDAVAGSIYFSSFDLTSGYFQIPLKEEDIPKSAFCCKFGQFEMTRMPFGLNNSASTFQRTMELALQGLQWETCLIYIDDIIVFGATLEEHLDRVEQVFERIRAAGLKFKPEKCSMLQTEVVFLGHVVSKEGIRPDPTNVSKILDWPKPETSKQVKQFVATGSYYRRFIKNFAKIAKPLTDLTKKDKVFEWNEKCDAAFNALKRALVSSDIMGYPLNKGDDFILDVDASGCGIGAVLSQKQDGKEKVIAYASRALNKAEKNYCITEKELLAVRFFIEYFRQYLLGRRFLVRSDHQALTWLFNMKEPSGKVARWIEILSLYDFAIEYRAGKKQGHCDALSRCQNPKECNCADVDTMEPLKCGPCKKCRRRAELMQWSGLPNTDENQRAERAEAAQRISEKSKVCKTTTPTESVPSTSTGVTHIPITVVTRGKWFWVKNAVKVRELQLQDPSIGPLLLAKESENKPLAKELVTASPASRHYWLLWDQLEVRNGVLFKRFYCKAGLEDNLQLIVPMQLRNDVLLHSHDALMGGHLGCKKTKGKILQGYYWYHLSEDVRSYVRKCDTCACNKRLQRTPKAAMGSLRVGAPWDTVATDFIGPLPVTERGNRYIMVLTDHFSKYVEVIPTRDQTAETCANEVLNKFVSRWGCPLTIHSDQGRNYESKVFQELCKILGINKTHTSIRHPQGNGQTERFNRTLVRMIKAYLGQEQESWDLHLGCIAGAYRSSPHESTGVTPNMLALGRNIRLPADLIFQSCGQAGQPEVKCGEYIDGLRTRMQTAYEIARRHLGVSAKRSKDLHDVRIAFHNYQVGDKVWCLSEARKLGVTEKLQPLYAGPFIVTKRLSDINFVLCLDKSGKEKVVHHDKLKPYEGSKNPKWMSTIKLN